MKNMPHPTIPYRNLPRILPFALFMGFIGTEELVRILATKNIVTVSAYDLALLYPVKVLAVAATLFIYRHNYSELNFSDLFRPLHTTISVVIGLIVFVLWVNMDWIFTVPGAHQGFRPDMFDEGATRVLAVTFRMVGAVLVVPVMEELFWRSFLIRYLINQDVDEVPLGMFTWSSFLFSSILFGLEHTMIVAGIMAGIFFNLLLYFTRSIALCILAHAIANLALAIYVLKTGYWHFW